jgi:AcrR family transcriptional regulator
VSQIAKRRAAAAGQASGANSTYHRRQEQILLAAGRVFHRLGFQATSLSDIAAEAGLDRASLYYYYGSKEELFHDVARRAVVSVIEAADAVASSEVLTPIDKLSQVIEMLMTSFESNYPQFYVFVQEDVSKMPHAANESEWADTVHGWNARYFNLVRSVISDGMESGQFCAVLPAGVIAHLVIGMLNYTSTWFTPDGILSAREIAQGMVDLLYGGLVPKLDKRPSRTGGGRR